MEVTAIDRAGSFVAQAAALVAVPPLAVAAALQHAGQQAAAFIQQAGAALTTVPDPMQEPTGTALVQQPADTALAGGFGSGVHVGGGAPRLTELPMNLLQQVPPPRPPGCTNAQRHQTALACASSCVDLSQLSILRTSQICASLGARELCRAAQTCRTLRA